jgi:hypothetical protein
MTKRYRFRAEIKDAGGGGAYIEFPHDVRKEFGTGGRVPIKATFDGEPYRGSLMAMGHPCHIVGLLKSIRATIGKSIGDTVTVVLERDAEERTVEVPPELKAALKAHPEAARRFATLSYTRRKELAVCVAEAKRPETRLRRAAKAVREILDRPARAPQ